MASCSSVIKAITVAGTNLPRCMALVELREGVSTVDGATLTTLCSGLHKANALQPEYSHVLMQHVLLFDAGSLPLTVKGTVQREKATQLYGDVLEAAMQGSPTSPSLYQRWRATSAKSGVGANEDDQNRATL